MKHLIMTICLFLLCAMFSDAAKDVSTISIVEDKGKRTVTLIEDNVWTMDLDRDLIAYDEADVPRTGDEIKEIKKGAKNRDAKAQYKLGLLYLTGEGGMDRSYSQALEMFELAETRHEPARNALGVMYLRGQGVPQNYNRGASFLRGGSGPLALFNLGYAEFWGLVEGNHLYTLEKAAREHLGIAELYLGLSHTRAYNYTQAYHWIILAIARDYDGIHAQQAKKIRDELAIRLGPEGMHASQKLTEWSSQRDKKPLIGVYGPSEK